MYGGLACAYHMYVCLCAAASFEALGNLCLEKFRLPVHTNACVCEFENNSLDAGYKVAGEEFGLQSNVYEGLDDLDVLWTVGVAVDCHSHQQLLAQLPQLQTHTHIHLSLVDTYVHRYMCRLHKINAEGTTAACHRQYHPMTGHTAT